MQRKGGYDICQLFVSSAHAACQRLSEDDRLQLPYMLLPLVKTRGGATRVRGRDDQIDKTSTET